MERHRQVDRRGDRRGERRLLLLLLRLQGGERGELLLLLVEGGERGVLLLLCLQRGQECRDVRVRRRGGGQGRARQLELVTREIVQLR